MAAVGGTGAATVGRGVGQPSKFLRTRRSGAREDPAPTAVTTDAAPSTPTRLIQIALCPSRRIGARRGNFGAARRVSGPRSIAQGDQRCPLATFSPVSASWRPPRRWPAARTRRPVRWQMLPFRFTDRRTARRASPPQARPLRRRRASPSEPRRRRTCSVRSVPHTPSARSVSYVLRQRHREGGRAGRLRRQLGDAACPRRPHHQRFRNAGHPGHDHRNLPERYALDVHCRVDRLLER